MLQARDDLGFTPVRTREPSKLSASGVEQYNQLGYAQPFTIFSAAEITNIRRYIDRLIEDMGEQGGYGINCYQARLATLWDIATDSRILDHVQDIIGPNIICWASAILSKQPGDPKQVPWHQDAGFWELSPARTVTVWLAIDDTDEANSAMRFIPGTHTGGALDTQDTGESSVFHMQTRNADALGEPFVNSLRAGQISLHADMLVHGSLPNRSNRRRCGLTLRYCPPEVRITNDEWAKGVEAIVCRGSAPNWKSHPRPDNDDITKTTSPRAVGNN
ncbi:MAG: phytanoyl-CoA dioxygenase family protein [Pseudomonadota bacterium]